MQVEATQGSWWWSTLSPKEMERGIGGAGTPCLAPGTPRHPRWMPSRRLATWARTDADDGPDLLGERRVRTLIQVKADVVRAGTAIVRIESSAGTFRTAREGAWDEPCEATAATQRSAIFFHNPCRARSRRSQDRDAVLNLHLTRRI